MLCLFVLMVHISVVGGTQNESYVHIHVHICIYRTTRQKSVHIYKIHWELYIYLFIYYIYLFICLNTCAAVVSAIPEAQATTMDFRKVEKQFRPAALLLQVVLCSFLLCYWGYSFKQILESSADPPVETTTVQWRKNLGLWALCSPGSLFGVGAASGGEVWGREKALTGAEPSAKEKLNGSLAGFSDGHFALLTCSFLDLTDFEIKVPFFFSLCIDSNTTSLLLLKEEGQWRYVTHQSPGTYNFYTLKKAIHGWNWGYSTSENSIFLINLLRGQSSHRTDRTIWVFCRHDVFWQSRRRSKCCALCGAGSHGDCLPQTRHHAAAVQAYEQRGRVHVMFDPDILILLCEEIPGEWSRPDIWSPHLLL